ncbi:hypothetical protein GpartN1_g5483.t1 [Galdieria partita]|uniref:Uncharacterized protein n=1 Tax=Galdieria partita TaxID=83374 RepID=A0A9C7Q1Y5_9RHOD|nr:hypothetical protein GpartN1_g5483.t1 [Galdieria partita]
MASQLESSRVPTPPPQLHLIFERPSAVNAGGRAAMEAMISVMSVKENLMQPRCLDLLKTSWNTNDYMRRRKLTTIPEDSPLLEWNAEYLSILN